MDRPAVSIAIVTPVPMRQMQVVLQRQPSDFVYCT